MKQKQWRRSQVRRRQLQGPGSRVIDQLTGCTGLKMERHPAFTVLGSASNGTRERML